MELLAISLALRLHELLSGKVSLYCDSLASIKYINRRVEVLRRARLSHRLLVQSDFISVTSIGSKPLCVREHPKHRKTDKDT